MTGGAGFIGSHLCERMLSDGHEVTALDNLTTGSRSNLKAAERQARFRFVQGAVEDGALLDPLIDSTDVVFHLAATVGVFNVIHSPARAITNNIDGTLAVLERAARRSARVVVASTSEVYGKSTALPFREEGDLVLGPSSKFRWSYACSKLIDEFLALAYGREQGLPTVVVRLFNTIGPRQKGHYGMVVPRFLTQALRGQKITVYGDGSQSRCFTYVGDVVEWLARLAFEPRAEGQVFNLGNPVEVSIGELAQRAARLCGSQAGIQKIPYDEAYGQGFEDMQRRVPDIAKVAELTGYRPQVELDEALVRVRDWLQDARPWEEEVESASGTPTGAQP